MQGNGFGSEFGYAVKRAQQAYRDRMDESLARFGLSTPQYVALNALDQLDGASNASLARACFVTPQTMHGILTGLERRLLIQRPTIADTGRALIAHLTDAGRELFVEAVDIVHDLDNAAVTDIGADQLSAALAALTQVTHNLRAMAEEVNPSGPHRTY